MDAIHLNDRQRAVLETLVGRYPALSAVQTPLLAAYHQIKDCFDRGAKLLLCGNGGSCADAEHIAGELVKGFTKKRPLDGALREVLEARGEDGRRLAAVLQVGLPAIPLNLSALSTAVINDLGGDMHFAQQVMALGQPGDVLLGISTSGNAQNIHLAALTAHAKGMAVIGLTGQGGGALRGEADVWIGVPETETYKVQELHLPLYHALCALLEEAYFPV